MKVELVVTLFSFCRIGCAVGLKSPAREPHEAEHDFFNAKLRAWILNRMRRVSVADSADTASTTTSSTTKIVNGFAMSTVNLNHIDHRLLQNAARTTTETTLTSNKNSSQAADTPKHSDTGGSTADPFTTFDGKPLVVPTPPPTVSKTKDTKNKSDDSKEADSDKSKDGNPYAIPIRDSDSSNETYTWNHYDTITQKSNNTYVVPWKSASLENITTDALQKNLSTTRTPFWPSEGQPPDNWIEIVGGLFGAISILLIIATIVRNFHANKKRKNYEEIQSLIV